MTPEDSHYSQTVSTLLQHRLDRFSDISTSTCSSSPYSAFSKWCSSHNRLGHGSSSQWLLKYILFTVPLLHSKFREETSASRSRKPSVTGQEELGANHVLAERRRREKLNERFVILRSLVPFVTKMDKASILGDTIEYVKQLRKRIQELEAKISGNRDVKKCKEKLTGGVTEQREGVVQVDVSIIENDGLIELQCPNREGFLLDVMQMLRELRVEITTIQSSINNGVFAAELRAKVCMCCTSSLSLYIYIIICTAIPSLCKIVGQVKENVNGKRATITEVKRAIHQIIPQYSVL